MPYRANAKAPKPYDKRLYREHNLIERFFCKLKDMRRMLERLDKLAGNFVAGTHIISIRRWINY